MKQERLTLESAVHSRDGNVRDSLLIKDYQYAHTVRGDEIRLEFDSGKLTPASDEVADYFVIAHGFYHGLRTYLYPNIDTSDSHIKEVESYVNELNQYLSEHGNNQNK